MQNAVLARSGEITPPCGVPVSVGVNTYLSITPALSQFLMIFLICGVVLSFLSSSSLVDSIKAAFYISIKDIFLFVPDCIKNGSNCILGASSWSEAIAIFFKLAFPFRFEGAFDQCLLCSLDHHRDTWRGLCSVFPGLWYPYPAYWFCFPSFPLVRLICFAMCILSAGGTDFTPSIPAVFFPWLSCVTLRTARAALRLPTSLITFAVFVLFALVRLHRSGILSFWMR